MTNEEFIAKSKKKYPNIFTYEKTRYINSEEKVIISHPLYGDFEVSPHYHLRKTSKTGGCKFLSNNINMNLSPSIRLDMFIEKGKKRFGDRFSYDFIDRESFKTNQSEILLVCKKHGKFKTTFTDHLRKDRDSGGCPLCSRNIGSRKGKNNKIMYFLNKAKIIFGKNSIYSYPKIDSEFSGLCDKNILTVYCKKHDKLFETSVPDHFRAKKTGCCPDCKRELKRKNILERRKKLYSKYIEESSNIHFNKYNYSKIDKSIPLNDKNVIICPIHGAFNQTMLQHHSGEGCPLCSDWNKDSLMAKHLKKYLIGSKPEFIITDDNYLINKPYDIYIERLNLLIEVQGEQHRKKKWSMTEKDLELRKEIDRNKKEKAINLGYNYLEVLDLSIKTKDNLINLINISTTIENLKENLNKLISLGKVEYTDDISVETRHS